MPLADGQETAGYTILPSLGAGGMGEVYLAQHPRLPRRDALKVLSGVGVLGSEYRQRFNREADIAATLWHPHIVEVHDRGDVDGQLWISMDYVEGTDAGRLLAERFPDGMAIRARSPVRPRHRAPMKRCTRRKRRPRCWCAWSRPGRRASTVTTTFCRATRRRRRRPRHNRRRSVLRSPVL